MGEHDVPCPGPAAEFRRVLGGRVAEPRLRREFSRQQESVVDQQVRTGREAECRVVILAPAIRSRAEYRRAMVGEVGDGGVAVADPVTEGAAALVRDLPRLDRETVRLG